MRIHQRIHSESEQQFRSLGISTAWFDVLAQLHGREGVTQQELSERLLVTKGNVSQLMAKMEDAGLIRRMTEGRSRSVWLTDAGRVLATTAIPLQEQRIMDSLAAVPDDEVSQLSALLGMWERNTRRTR